MKRLTIALLLFLSMGAAFGTTVNYFSVGENGVLRISPNDLASGPIVPVKLHLVGRIDSWTIRFTYPNALNPQNVSRLSGMTDIPYLDANGDPQTYSATLTDSCCTVFTSTIYGIEGYWEPNNLGVFISYGTVKWEAGDHDMFQIHFLANGDCTGDTIRINGYASSTTDYRGGTTGGTLYSESIVRVAYKLGDVNGDESVNIVDATLLINYLTNPNVDLNSYQLAAADINGDGQVNISDAMLLINIINGSNNFAGM